MQRSETDPWRCRVRVHRPEAECRRKAAASEQLAHRASRRGTRRASHGSDRGLARRRIFNRSAKTQKIAKFDEQTDENANSSASPNGCSGPRTHLRPRMALPRRPHSPLAIRYSPFFKFRSTKVLQTEICPNDQPLGLPDFCPPPPSCRRSAVMGDRVSSCYISSRAALRQGAGRLCFERTWRECHGT